MQKRYSPGIDFFRALAIVSVILYHLPNYPFEGGIQGVTIFFVVSGFLMAKNTEYAYQHNQFSITDFYKKRIKRIYPFLLFSTVFFILLGGMIHIRLLGNIKNELPSLLFGYNNWWQMAEGVSYFDHFSNSSLFKHYWFLSVELQICFMWPFIYLLLKKLRKKRGFQFLYGCIFFSLILNYTLSPSIAYYHTFARLYPFLFGVFGFMNSKNISHLFQTKRMLQFWLLTAGLILIIICPFLSFVGSSVIVSLLSTYLLVLIGDKEVEDQIKSDKFHLHYLGKISYQLYLIHYPVLVILLNLKLEIGVFTKLLLIFVITLIMIVLYKYITIHIKKRSVRLVLATAGVLSIGMILLAPADRLTKDQQELQSSFSTNAKKIENQDKEQGEILFLGDSVMLGAYQELKTTFHGYATIDAKESRQITSIVDILQNYPNLQDYSSIVIGLGTNGVISDDSIKETMTRLSGKLVFWINIKCPNEWQDHINQTLAELPSIYTNVTIIDWFEESDDHPEYFYDDHTHLNEIGRQAYANLLDSALSAAQRVD